MKLLISCSILLLLVTVSSVKGNWQKYEDLMANLDQYPELLAEWKQVLAEQNASDATRRSAPPTCEPYSSPSVPTSVHQLTPGDIKVVGAMGDSLTAANGADTALLPMVKLREYRGFAFAIGGYKSYPDVITMPNILRQFSPDLTGYSTGTGKRDSDEARLNVAYPGNTASNMPEQAEMLVARMKADPTVDFQNDWKIVTIFIGGNDLCVVCDDRERYSVANYRANMKIALDILHRELPRTLVNVISIMDIAPITMMKSGWGCMFVHKYICDCADDEPVFLKKMAVGYSDEVKNMILSRRYDTRDDFTVVFQPFMRDSDMPTTAAGKPDRTFFAPDCFHFSRKGHAAAATMYWNGLFEPVGSKTTDASFNSEIKCPAKGTLIATSGNKKGTKG